MRRIGCVTLFLSWFYLLPAQDRVTLSGEVSDLFSKETLLGVTILIPEGRIPWSGHSGKYAANQVMAEIAARQTTLVEQWQGRHVPSTPRNSWSRFGRSSQ